MALIVLMEDDLTTVKLITEVLKKAGHQVLSADNGVDGLALVHLHKPQLVISDVQMPRMDGYDLLSRLREKSDLPVIFLTSKDDEADEAAGLALGADDYIAKPFSQRLLIARIRAILRRGDLARHAAARPQGEDDEPLPDLIRRGRLAMDPARHLVEWAGQPVSLTVTEFLILEALALRPGVVRSRSSLMDAAYQDDVFVDDRTIDSHIKRLRRKFRIVDPQFGAIETLYGAGYSFADA